MSDETESGADEAASTSVLPPPTRRDATEAGLTRLEPQPIEPIELRWQWVAGALAVGLAFDAAFRRMPWSHAAMALLVLVAAAALAGSGFVRTRSGRLLLAAAVFFGAWLAWRTQPALGVFNFVSAFSLLGLAAVHGKGRDFWDLAPSRLVADTVLFLLSGLEGLVDVPVQSMAHGRQFRDRLGRTTVTGPIVRGLALAVPLVLVLGALLASADAVFGSFFSGVNVPNSGPLIGHLMLGAIGAFGAIMLLRLASTGGASRGIQASWSLGPIEIGIVLGAMSALFAAFAVAQVMTVLGGADAALARADLDPKQFARQGFFQLLWVAGITLVTVLTLHVLGRGDSARRVLRVLTPVTVTLTAVIVVVAVTRILFYIGDGGLTPLRLYSAVFACWILVCFLLAALRVGGWRPDRAWLTPAILVSGLLVLAGLNVANPERLVAIDNLNRGHEALFYHVEADQFTGDGDVVLVRNLDRLDPDLAERIQLQLCREHVAAVPSTATSTGLLSFNWGRQQGRAELEQLCRS